MKKSGEKIEWKNLNTLESFKKLLATKNAVKIAKELSSKNASERIKKFSIPMAANLQFNFAAKEVNEKIISLFEKLAKEADVIKKFESVYSGEIVNTGEKRMVLHHLTRGQLGCAVFDGKKNKRDFYIGEQKKIAEFAKKIHDGKITNEKGERYESVCQIGIGGSDLGPRAMYLALETWAKKNKTLKMKAHFISNVDPDDASSVLQNLNLSKTLFILVSKSGTTLETLANQLFVTDFLKKENLEVSKHMIAVTSETSPLAKSKDFMARFFMDDFIGGRYSSTSPVGGVVLSLAFGEKVFANFLSGAHEEDKLSMNEDVRKNPALMDALIGVYERNVQKYETTAILPYSQALVRFPAHLQQLDMESNGKSVNRFGKKLTYKTGPIIFGEPGTNGQHSFYQLLHQGTTIVPLQFIAFQKNQSGFDIKTNGSTSQTKLNANAAAQIVAFACGKDDVNKNKFFAGARPSSVIYGNELNPQSLGALLSHFENKVMFQGFLWNVNSFDQEGVQLGKKLATAVLDGETSGALSSYAEMIVGSNA